MKKRYFIRRISLLFALLLFAMEPLSVYATEIGITITDSVTEADEEVIAIPDSETEASDADETSDADKAEVLTDENEDSVSLRSEDTADIDDNGDTHVSHVSKGFGYNPMPGEKEAPVVDNSLNYNSMKSQLNDSTVEIERLGATMEAQGATSASSAFPYSYTDEDEILAYLNNYYPNPRNQGNEGTCWAHSALAMSEFYMISHNMADRNVDFSEMHLSYWAYTQGTPSIAGNTGDYVYCYGGGGYGDSIYGVGGNTYMAALTLMQRRGVADESVAPYSWVDDPSKSSLDASTERQDTAYLKNAYMISRSNTKLIKDTLLKNGLVGVSFATYDDCINEEAAAYYDPYTDDTTHAVAIVGWDDDYPRDNFAYYDYRYNKTYKPSKNGAWLVRNSLTTDSKIDYKSYFWLSYEDKSMSDVWVYEMMDPTDPDFDNNYYYDSQIHPSNRTNAKKSANIYRASGESAYETLQAVYFDVSWMSSGKVNYTIDIYKDVTPSAGPESGDKVAEDTTTGVINLSGMYTIPLNDPVELKHGEYYSVVITLSDGKSVNYECGGLGWEGITQYVGAGSYQSYIYSGNKWTDFGSNENKNLVIHALTANGRKGGYVELSQNEVCFGESAKVGDASAITAEIYDADNNPVAGTASWHSDDRSVVTVDNGVITVVGNGETTVTAGYGGFESASCTVKVNIREHSVTFDSNGGSFASVSDKGGAVYDEKRKLTVLNGGTAFIERPRKANYVFVKWTDGDGADFDTDSPIMKDMAITAVWEAENTLSLPIASVNDGERIESTGGDTVYQGDAISLYCEASDDARIYYTTDGSVPTTESTLYTDPIIVGKTTGVMTVKAFAVLSDYNASAVSTFVFGVERDTDSEWGDITDEDKPQIGLDADGGPKSIPDGLWVADASYQAEVTYTGTPITFDELRIYNNNRLLSKGTDYTVTYTNNKVASEGAAASKKPAIVIKGKGNYTGQESVNFEIKKAALPDAVNTVIKETYTGKAIKSVPEFYYNGTALKNKTDFECDYSSGNFTDSGDHIISVTGKGNFTGTRSVTLSIAAKDTAESIAKARLTGFASSIVMSPDPSVTEFKQPDALKVMLGTSELSDGEDYDISYINNEKAGTATMFITGKGAYSGTVKKTYKITQLAMNKATIVPASFADKVVWNVTACENGGYIQTPGVKYGDFTLTKDTDYAITYKNNNKAGNATMILTGLGRYKGTLNKTFKISAYDIKSDPDDLVRIKHTSKYGDENTYDPKSFNGRWLYSNARTSAGSKPIINLYYNGAELKSGVDYTITYKNNKKYNWRKPAVLTITGKGAFLGSLSAKFNFDDYTDLTNAEITAPDMVRSNKKKGLLSTPTVTLDGVKLKAGSDYSKSFKYSYLTDVKLTNGAVKKAGAEVSKDDILIQGTTARIRVKVSDVYGFTSVSTSYAVKAGSVASAKITVNGGKAYDYTGSAVYPKKDDLEVKIGSKLLSASDYEIVKYENADKTGNAKIYIRGKGDYCGEKSQTYRIGKRKLLWFSF